MNETARTVPGDDYDVDAVRRDFPILHQQVNGHPLVYLDNGATSQKPQCVIDRIVHHYSFDNSNVHRGVHTLSARATQAYESARETIRGFINAADTSEIVFVRGASEAINLVAQSYARPRLQQGDEVLITEMEHHSNIVPWQMVCGATGAALRVVPITDAGELDMQRLHELLGSRTRILAMPHISNALGTVNPVAEIVARARELGAVTLVDGAQAAPHAPIDVQSLGCDFYAFSGHKVYGPSGTGVLYGRAKLLKDMPPYQGGGEMIRKVTFEDTLYAPPPHRFEAGTPNIEGAIGLATAIDYLTGLGLDKVMRHEADLLDYATSLLSAMPAVRLIGTAAHKAAIVTFLIDGVHAHDVGTIMDSQGIAIRAGHHCAMPVMQHYKVAATTRASFGLYNTRAEVDALAGGIEKVIEVMGR